VEFSEFNSEKNNSGLKQADFCLLVAIWLSQEAVYQRANAFKISIFKNDFFHHQMIRPFSSNSIYRAFTNFYEIEPYSSRIARVTPMLIFG